MTDATARRDPEAARTSAEFVAVLKQIKDASGLSYREIQRRAATAGRSLPSSTLGTMLSRTTLPREELVVALLRACELDAEQARRLLMLRRELAASRTAASISCAGAINSPTTTPNLAGRARDENRADRATRPAVVATAPPVAFSPTALPSAAPPAAADLPSVAAADAVGGNATTSRTSRPVLVGVIAAVLTFCVLAGGLALVADQGNDPADGMPPAQTVTESWAASDLPTPGYYRLRATHSGLCLSEKAGAADGRLFQTNCDTAMPAVYVRQTARGFLLETFDPASGLGCLGVSTRSTAVGAAVRELFCRTDNAVEFHLEPVVTPPAGLRVRAAHSGLCVGVLDASLSDWAPAEQVGCEPSGHGQVFVFDPVPGPAASAG